MEDKKEFKSQYERVTEITEKLEAGITGLFESDKYKEWLTTMGKFHNYSLNNTLLIAMQKPDATYVAGYQAWQDKFGRHVKKGEKGIQILAPCKYKKKELVDKVSESGVPVLDVNGQPQKEEITKEMSGFKVTTVFDISSTEGKELPTIGVDQLTGDVAEFNKFMAALEKISPVPIGFEDIASGAKGYYHLADKRIAIQQGMSEIQTLKTLVHEMSHARLHSIEAKAENPEAAKLTRGGKEVEAESVAFTVLSHFGIDCSDYSFSYIAQWSQGKELPELKESLKTIRQTANAFITEINDAMKEQMQEKEAGDGFVESTDLEGMDNPFGETSIVSDAEAVADKKPSVLGFLKVTDTSHEHKPDYDRPIKITSDMAI
ncbi:MAG: hypothetical protein HUJ98_09820 [Bacteroidaceae bacterium]|nr:hypothetical protein [Bacteroidaceae bacterium]